MRGHAALPPTVLTTVLLAPSAALAADGIDSGGSAWILTSTPWCCS